MLYNFFLSRYKYKYSKKGTVPFLFRQLFFTIKNCVDYLVYRIVSELICW